MLYFCFNYVLNDFLFRKVRNIDILSNGSGLNHVWILTPTHAHAYTRAYRVCVGTLVWCWKINWKI